MPSSGSKSRSLTPISESWPYRQPSGAGRLNIVYIHINYFQNEFHKAMSYEMQHLVAALAGFCSTTNILVYKKEKENPTQVNAAIILPC